MIASSRSIGRLFVGGVIGTLLVVVLLGTGEFVRAAEGVNLNNQEVTCDSIVVTYTVLSGQELDYALVYAHRADGTEIGLANGPGSSGQHSVTVTFPAEPAGTSLYARVSVGSGEIGRVEATGTPTPCSGGGGDGPSEDVEPVAGDNPGSETGSVSSSWAGYSDGRLNPDPAEYYSVWCANDRIDVYRSIPQTGLLKIIPLADVVELSVGAAMDLGDFMTLVRNSDDGVTIYGSNGNLAPEPGSKAFSLSECIARNGGLPEPPPPAPSDSGDSAPAGNEETDARREVQEYIAFCLDAQEFFGNDPELFVNCLEGVAEQEGASTLEILWAWLFQGCLAALMASTPLLVLVGRRRFHRLKP